MCKLYRNIFIMSVSDFLQECEIKCMKKNIEKSLDFWKSLQGVCFCVRKRKISRKKSRKHTPEALQANIRSVKILTNCGESWYFLGIYMY